MEWITGKSALSYAGRQLRGHLFAFISGMSAANLVSMFFETRRMGNLWGLTAKRTVIDRNTFGLLQWTCSLVIGFIAFEVVNRLMRRWNPYVEKIGPFFRSIRLLVGSSRNRSGA